jgi:hypothetical protein
VETILGGLVTCLFVLAIAVIASIVAAVLLSNSLRRKSSGSLVAGGGASAVGTGGLSLNELRDIRNIVWRTVSPRSDEVLALAFKNNPHADRDVVARKIIDTEASKCGFIGFITGAPGLFALPLTLPIDLYTTGRLQASMIEALVMLYEPDIDADEVQRTKVMVLLGGGSLAKSAAQLMLKVAGGSAVRAIPLLGAIAGFAANYFLTQAAGRAAQAHFSRRRPSLDHQPVIEGMPAVPRLPHSLGNTPQLGSVFEHPDHLAPATGVTQALVLPAAPSFPPQPSEARSLVNTAIGDVLPSVDPTPAGDEPDRLRACAACGEQNQKHYQFCAGCGQTLVGEHP